MKLVFFGTSPFGLPCLDSIRQSQHQLLAVVTFPDKPSGRKLELKPSAVKRWALDHSIPAIEMVPYAESECFTKLKMLSADLFVVISFGKILKKEYLGLPKLGPLNVHASLLPKYRGASPMQQAILNGEPETGVSVMRMVEAMDAGDVLLSKKMNLDKNETIVTLEPKLQVLAAAALMESLSLIEAQTGKVSWQPQNSQEASYCAKIKKEDGRLIWTHGASWLDREIRAFLSWPGSFAFFNEKRIVVKKAAVREGHACSKPGKIAAISPEGILVETSQGLLLLEELQLEGRNSLKAAAFLNGFTLKTGDILE